MLHLKYDQPKTLLKRIDEGGVGPQNGHQAYIYHPINLHGVDFRFLNFEHLNPMGELWQRQT